MQCCVAVQRITHLTSTGHRGLLLQGRLEDVAFQLRIPQRKPWQAMADNVAAASAVVAQRDKVRSPWRRHAA